MTLGFSQEIKGVKNFFVKKIWKSLVLHEISSGVFYVKYQNQHFAKFLRYWDGSDTSGLKPKLHTIRQGVGRWRAGMNIHMVINNRTANRFQFAPTIKCKSVQKIEIKWNSKHIVTVYIDGKSIHADVLEVLAVNDGFNSLADFFAYFDKDFTGTLIHWTDLKY